MKHAWPKHLLVALGLAAVAAVAAAAEKFTLAPDRFAQDAPPGRKADAVTAYERYLELAPAGKFARDVKGILRGLKG